MKKPTIPEIAEYIAEKGYDIDAEYFWHKNEAVGWVVGTTCKPMKSWKSTLFTWSKRKQGSNPKKSYTQRSLEGRARAVGVYAKPGWTYDEWEREIAIAERRATH